MTALNASIKKKPPVTNFTPTVLPIQKNTSISYNDLDEIKLLSQYEVLKPFCIPQLIPDLLYLYKNRSLEELVNIAQLADKNNPKSILFIHPLQNKNKEIYNNEKLVRTFEAKAIESSTLICSKCGKNKIFISQKQTSSLDEGKTYFYKCANCGNQWVSG